ncbi:MAG: TIGR03546 family protein [bacterium]
MFLLKFISKFIKVLHAGESPSLIAAGFTMGFVVGLTPFWTLQNMILLIIAVLTRVNLASVFFAIFLFSFVTTVFDPLYHALGYYVLAQIENIKPVWTALYNWPIAPYTRFNNTVVMGSLLVALALTFPVYVGSRKGIMLYRQTWGKKLENSRIVKAIRGSALYRWYVRIKDLEWK